MGPSEHKSCLHKDDIVNSAGGTVVVRMPTEDETRTHQRLDPTVAHIIAYLEDPTAFLRDEQVTEDEKKDARTRAEDFMLVRGLLFFLDATSSSTIAQYDAGGKPLLYVPKGLRNRVLHTAHCAAGHFGVSKTLGRLRQGYWWPRMRHDTRRFVRKCHGALQSRQEARHGSAGVRLQRH